MKILWFTDAHITPGEDLSRFSRLGSLILRERPDVIVQGGDFVTLDTFSRWDKDKRLKIEGLRYKNDLAAAEEAIERLSLPIKRFNTNQQINHKAQYFPAWYWFQGNHEYWADEYVMRNPEMEGIIDILKDLNLRKLPGDVFYIPYKEENWFRKIGGIYFCHAPRNRTGVISSKYIADKALEVFGGSVIFGHTHRLLSSSCSRTGDNKILRSISGGCFFEKDPTYAVGHNNDYWRGVLLINTLGDTFAVTEVPMEHL